MTTRHCNPVHVFFVFLIVALFTSCNENNMDANDGGDLTTEQAVAIIESALVEGAGGVASSIDEILFIAEEYTEKSSQNPCGEVFDSTYNKDFGGSRFSASYSTSWDWVVNCEVGIVPTSLDLNRTAIGTYSGPLLSASDEVTETWTIDNLVAGGNWIIAGAHIRTGDYDTKNEAQPDFTADLDLDIAEIAIGKTSYEIISGSGSVSVTLEGSNGEKVTWEGSLEFPGDGTIILTINGEPYIFDING